jgi:hypothetical protein
VLLLLAVGWRARTRRELSVLLTHSDTTKLRGGSDYRVQPGVRRYPVLYHNAATHDRLSPFQGLAD